MSLINPDRIRLVAVDLDETLLGVDHQISPRNALAVYKLVEKEILVVIASGRMYTATVPFCIQLRLTGPVVTYNGALVKEIATGAVYHHQPLPAGAAQEIVEFAEERGYHLNYYLNDVLYVKEETQWSDLYRSRTGSPIHPVGSLRQFDGQQPTKIILLDTPEETDRLLPVMRGKYGSQLYITKTNPEYLEFMDAGVSKGEALRVIGERLGISREEMAAFGDSYNDLPMLEYAGLAIAMGNAKPELKVVADYIAPSYEEEGFATAVEEIWDVKVG